MQSQADPTRVLTNSSLSPRIKRGGKEDKVRRHVFFKMFSKLTNISKLLQMATMDAIRSALNAGDTKEDIKIFPQKDKRTRTSIMMYTAGLLMFITSLLSASDIK